MNSSDEDMERMLARYFLNDEWAARGFQSLTSVFERIPRPSGWRDSYFDSLTTAEEKGALSAILERMSRDGLLNKRQGHSDFEAYYAAGEQLIARTSRFDSHSDGTVFSQGTGYAPAPDREFPVEPISVDSRTWTGRTGRVLADANKREELIRLLKIAEDDLALVSVSNSERAIARAYIIAAKTLADAPDPPEDLVWELIARANSLAGVASLFIAVIALFASVGK